MPAESVWQVLPHAELLLAYSLLNCVANKFRTLANNIGSYHKLCRDLKKYFLGSDICRKQLSDAAGYLADNRTLLPAFASIPPIKPRRNLSFGNIAPFSNNHLRNEPSCKDVALLMEKIYSYPHSQVGTSIGEKPQEKFCIFF